MFKNKNFFKKNKQEYRERNTMKYVFSLLALLALGATELRAVEQGGTTKIQIKISAVSHAQPLLQPLVKTETLQDTGPIHQDVTFDIPVTKVLPVTNGAANWFTDHQFLESLAEKGTWKAIKVTGKKRLASRKEACKEEYVWVHENENKKFRFCYNEIEQENFIKSVVEQLGGELLVHKARNQRPGVPHQKCWCPFPKLSPEQLADLAERFNIKKVKNPKKNKAKKTNNNLLQQKNVQEKISQSQQSPDQDVTLNAEVFQQQQPSAMIFPANPQPLQQEIGHKNPVPKVLPITDRAFNWYTDYQFLDILAKRGTWITTEVIDKKRFPPKTEEYIWFHDNHYQGYGFCYNEIKKDDFIKSVISFFGGDLLAQEAPNQRPGVPLQKCWRPCPKLSPEQMEELVECFRNNKVNKSNDNQLKQEGEREKLGQSQQSPHQNVTLNAEERQQQQYAYQSLSYPQYDPFMGYPANPQTFQHQYPYQSLSLSYPQYDPFMGYPANPFQQQYDSVIVLKLNHVGCPYKTYNNNKDEQLLQQLLQQNSRLISILQTLTTPPTSK